MFRRLLDVEKGPVNTILHKSYRNLVCRGGILYVGVVDGPAGKNFYGSIFAKSIVVLQYTKVTWVPFIPVQVNGVVAKREGLRVLDYSVNFLGV